jgi:hypothetical protein
VGKRVFLLVQLFLPSVAATTVAEHVGSKRGEKSVKLRKQSSAASETKKQYSMYSHVRLLNSETCPMDMHDNKKKRYSTYSK